MNSESIKVDQNEHILATAETQEVVVPAVDPSVKVAELNEAISIHVNSANETEDKIAALRAELGVTGETEAPSVDIARKNAAELITERDAIEGGSSREAFAENHIMSENILNKIAQLEAINPNTGEFDQNRYDEYINGQAKLGAYSVGANQEKIKKALDSGRTIDRARGLESIYGTGGWNRYVINPDGSLKLSRGSSVTTGTELYKAALEEKAREFGFDVGL